jgi:mono/diheme cytochrome c family protein
MKSNTALFNFLLLSILFLSFQSKPKFDLKASMAKGKDIYQSTCMSCHMENGEGLEDVYPPLAKSDYMMADRKRMIQQILYGATGPQKVNGKTYNGEMTGFDLTDQEVSDLSNYIRNSFGNKSSAITPEEVKAARKK